MLVVLSIIIHVDYRRTEINVFSQSSGHINDVTRLLMNKTRPSLLTGVLLAWNGVTGALLC